MRLRQAATYLVIGMMSLTIGTDTLAQQRQRPPVRVEVEPVDIRPVEDTITVSGTVQSNQSVDVSAEVPGRIEGVLFQDGQAVEQGQPLFRLDDSLLTTALAEAEATLSVDRRNYERARNLASRGVGSVRAEDEALSDLREIEARVAVARVMLEKAVIRAPFSGVVGFREIDVGAFVNPGDGLVTLDDIDPVKVVFRVPERFAAAVQARQPIDLRVDALPTEQFIGTVNAVAPRLDANGRALQVQAVVPNPERRLIPGMFARVTLTLERRNGALVIPEQAVVPEGTRTIVYRMIEGKASATQIRLGRREAGFVEVVEGLSDGDIVVTAGQLKLRDGADITPVGVGGGSQAGGGAADGQAGSGQGS